MRETSARVASEGRMAGQSGDSENGIARVSLDSPDGKVEAAADGSMGLGIRVGPRVTRQGASPTVKEPASRHPERA